MDRKRCFSAISSSEISAPVRRWQIYRHLVFRENVAVAEEETSEAVESEESETEEIKTYNVVVQGERWVVSEEIRDLVQGFIASMANNGVNGGMPLKVKPILKWIVGPAVARKRVRIVRPLH